MIFQTISTLPCRLGEESHSTAWTWKFLRCLVATRIPLHRLSRCLFAHLEWKSLCLQRCRTHAGEVETDWWKPARASSRLWAFYKLPGRDGSGESCGGIQEASLGYIRSQGQLGKHSETLSQINILLN